MSAAASATNQNAWIGYMKQELKKYPKMKLVATVYGNDDPTTATQVTQGLLQQYPNLKGIISPTTVGILAAAGVLDTAKYRGKVELTGLGTPDSMKKYVSDGTVKAFELWNPANLGYLAGVRGRRPRLAARSTARRASTFTAGKLGIVHRRRRQHRAARPAVRLQLRQHRQVQLLTACRVGRAGPLRAPTPGGPGDKPAEDPVGTRLLSRCACGPSGWTEYRERHAHVWPEMRRGAGRGGLGQLLAVPG